MGYLTLYRKYRPKQFEEIKGQEHIIKTLVNSLKEKRVSHAYLFSGPRGTGKTTTARIFAKGLNCEKGITPYPCDKCKNCISIMNGTHMDVIEIDAASNRGIDEIRNLKERINLSPSMGRYRVFIIDEVHMLTQEAFNALLKTLEEPPPHAVFILATTDPQKVPNTILSRCIRFNFKRIGIKNLMETAREILSKEGVEAEEDVIRKVAEASYGSLRDLLSILEQLILYSGDRITLKDLKELLGETEESWLKKFYTSMRNGDDATVLSLIGNVIDSGKEVKQILLDLINYGRKLLMAKVFGKDMEEAKYFRRSELVSIIENFMDILPELRYSDYPRLLLEIKIEKLILKLFARERTFKIKPTLEKEKVEKTEKEETSFVWEEFLSMIKKKDEPLYMLMRPAKFKGIEGSAIKVEFPYNYKFHRDKTEEKMETLKEILKELGLRDFELVFSLEEEESYRKKEEELLNLPEVKKVLKYFKGKIKKIEDSFEED